MKHIYLIIILFSWVGSSFNLLELPDEVIKMQNLKNRLVWVESRWNVNARSHKNAYGLWQITKPVLDDINNFTGSQYTINDLFDPISNTIIGNWQLERLLRQFNGSIVNAINSYNMGPVNTYRGKYYYTYLLDICPWEWLVFIRDKKIVKVEGNIMYIDTGFNPIRLYSEDVSDGIFKGPIDLIN